MRLVTKAKTCIIDVGTNVLAVLIILVWANYPCFGRSIDIKTLKVTELFTSRTKGI